MPGPFDFSGNGTNTIYSDLGIDVMTGGTGVDTYQYFDAAEAGVLSFDTNNGFNATAIVGSANDIISFSSVFGTSLSYLGAFANATLANAALQVSAAVLQLVLVNEVDGQYLYADANGDGLVGTGDIAIKMVGLTGTLDQTDFLFTA